MAHLLFVGGCDELSRDDAAERRQRLLALGIRQLTPKLVEPYAPAENFARGGAMTAVSRDMGRLLGPIVVEPESIQPAAAGW
jgi:hypothetical protein